MIRKTLKISIVLACLISPNVYAGGDASQALQSIQWATAETGNAVSLAKQIEQITIATNNLQQNIQAVQMAQQNLKALSSMDVSNFNKYIDQLTNIMRSTNGIAYNMSDLDTKFSTTFPGYDEHMKQGLVGTSREQASSFSQYYKSLTDQNRGTALGTLQNLRATNQDLQDDQLNMNMLKLQSRSSNGNLSAIQAANEIAMHQTDTLKKLHSTMLMQTNLMAQQSAQQNEEKAVGQAQIQRFLTSGKKPVKGDEKNIKTW